MKVIGIANLRRGKLHFDETCWALIKEHARRAHKTPKQIVVAALFRGFRFYGKKTKDA